MLISWRIIILSGLRVAATGHKRPLSLILMQRHLLSEKRTKLSIQSDNMILVRFAIAQAYGFIIGLNGCATTRIIGHVSFDRNDRFSLVTKSDDGTPAQRTVVSVLQIEI